MIHYTLNKAGSKQLFCINIPMLKQILIFFSGIFFMGLIASAWYTAQIRTIQEGHTKLEAEFNLKDKSLKLMFEFYKNEEEIQKAKEDAGKKVSRIEIKHPDIQPMSITMSAPPVTVASDTEPKSEAIEPQYPKVTAIEIPEIKPAPTIIIKHTTVVDDQFVPKELLQRREELKKQIAEVSRQSAPDANLRFGF
jgi:hypothetical protein